MKNFLSKLSLKPVLVLVLSAFMLGVTMESNSQLVYRKAKDSISNAVTRYITWTSTVDGVYGFQILFDSVSGTPAATVTLETRIDTLNSSTWVPYKRNDGGTAQSHTLTTLPDTKSAIFVVDLQYGNGYRFKIVPTGTQKNYVYASYIRRGRR